MYLFVISKSEIKLIRSLKQKKYRAQYGLFVAEGEKLVLDFIQRGCNPVHCFVQEGFDAPPAYQKECRPIDGPTMKSLSQLATPSPVLAVFEQFPEAELSTLASKESLLCLDGVRDPGNLGTLLRLAHWFGVGGVLLSQDSVDAYNAKTVQASMGSLANVPLWQGNLSEALHFFNENHFETFVATLSGDDVFTGSPTSKYCLIMGSESHGPSKEVLAAASRRVTIPAKAANPPESLNVAIATAIILSAWQGRG